MPAGPRLSLPAQRDLGAFPEKLTAPLARLAGRPVVRAGGSGGNRLIRFREHGGRLALRPADRLLMGANLGLKDTDTEPIPLLRRDVMRFRQPGHVPLNLP
jgi:hypothetical protein